MSLLTLLRSSAQTLVIDDVSVPRAIQTTDVSTTLTSASFTPTSANQLMLVCANLNQSVTTNTFTISDSVNGSSGWTQAILQDGSNSTFSGSAAIWYRLSGSTAARTITMTDSVGRTKTFKTYLITGQDLTTPIGASFRNAISTGSNVATGYTSTKANSVGFISATEFQGNNPFLTSTDNDDLYYLTARYAALGGYKNSITAPIGAAVTFDIQFPTTGQNINYAVVEINRAVAVVQGITSNTFDGVDTSSAQLSPTTAINSTAIDGQDLSNAQLTSSTSINSAASDRQDLSNASISPASSISANSIDGADVSNALISPIQSSSITSAVIDGADLNFAQLTSSTAITSASNDLSDLSNAQLTSLTSIAATNTDGADISNALISPIISGSVQGVSFDGADVSNAQLSPATSITGNSTDGADISAAQLTPITNVTAVNTDGVDRSNASVSPTTSLSAINIDGLDVSIAALSPSAQISSNAIDGADISNALISPSGQSTSISSATVDGADTNSATLAPTTSISSNVIDGLDYAGLPIDETVILSPASYKYTGNHYVRRTSPTFPAYVPAVKIIKEKLPEVIETSLIDAFNLPTAKINVEAIASKIKVNEKLLVSIRAEKSRLNDEINALHLLALAAAKRKKQLLLLMLFEFMA